MTHHLSQWLGIAALLASLGTSNSGAAETSSASLGHYHLDPSQSRETYGGGSEPKVFFNERLTACFERTLKIIRWEGKDGFAWVFTGPRAGVVIRVRPHEVSLDQRFYDSLALALQTGTTNRAGASSLKHPEWLVPGRSLAITNEIKSVTVGLDARLGLTLSVNGQPVARLEWMHDLVHHQIRLEGSDTIDFEALEPAPAAVAVTVNPAETHQKILGFGGIVCPPAFHELSAEGRREWWRLLTEYNLRLHREYPMGAQLHPAMDNWDNPADAVPHYYGDNFPNSEVSDFDYLKELRAHDGIIMFEFWRLPFWARTNVDRYAAAMVRYCELCRDRTGRAPEIVGVENEVAQTAATFQKMVLTLRAALDAAGFSTVKIHMADNPTLKGGIDWLKIFKARPDVWRAIDYAATHMYDYQNFFTHPDGYDALMQRFRADAGDHPVLATELCVNAAPYQTDSYRVALQMGQLYQKNLVLLDATAIAYCWLLLNVEQPTYGMTRSLFVPDLQQGGVPVASSHQLRVFGAYSRHIQAGMVRVATVCADPDLLVAAFAGSDRQGTIVAMNRSSHPVKLQLHWPGMAFSQGERCGPYAPNQAVPASERTVAPGEILTLTSVPGF